MFSYTHSKYLRMFYTYFQNDDQNYEKVTGYSKSHLKVIRQI